VSYVPMCSKNDVSYVPMCSKKKVLLRKNATMKIKDIIQFLETIAPPAYQENYDNAGLIVGNPDAEVTGILTCLDSLETIVDEAITNHCNLIVAHHPIVFRGLKRLNGKNYVERIVLKAIKNDIAIYAIHTNLDNVLQNGVNQQIANRLGLKNLKILAPKKQTLMQLTVFVPIENTQTVLNALYAAGAGQIGDYENCSFKTTGIGTFRPVRNANPHIGALNQDEEVAENRIEVILETHLQNKVLKAMRQAHPYQEVAYFLTALENENQTIGAGIIGEYEAENALSEMDFLKFLKQKMVSGIVRYTQLRGKSVRRVAICGGSGSFLLGNAIGAGADVFVTADFKYHEFFDADGKIVITDIGHFESEQFTIDLLTNVLQNKFKKICVFSTKKDTNPVNYL
jgi:dinuclear metal center YbgI/SA1388 family protein